MVASKSSTDIGYEAVIGLEVHAQLITESKMFCSCAVDYFSAEPNTRVCPVCLGMPGVLPTINKKAVEYVIMTGLALNCQIAQGTKFDRKNYPYPDLMKGYQISQYDQPIASNGWLSIQAGGETKSIGITRVHLEEDTAKLIHRQGNGSEGYSQVDVNRSGVPLMEIVGEPDLRSPEEARLYLMKLRTILQYLGVSRANMEEGNFRCDANVSIRPIGSQELYSKVEVKNMNSFRSVYRALAYEVERQERLVKEGQRIPQETRGWVEDKGITVSQRSKEYAHDYRYFPEPDLPPMVIDRDWVHALKSHLPELPDSRRERLIKEHQLPPSDVDIIVSSRDMAEFFDQCLEESKKNAKVNLTDRARAINNWLLGDFSHLLNAQGLEVSQAKVTPSALVAMLNLLDEGTISGKMAKSVFEEMFNTGQPPDKIVQDKGMVQITDKSEIESVVDRVLKENPTAVADFHSGKKEALTFLVGQVMKATRGRANPGLVNQLLRNKLERE